jgi:hypothetical protein
MAATSSGPPTGARTLAKASGPSSQTDPDLLAAVGPRRRSSIVTAGSQGKWRFSAVPMLAVLAQLGLQIDVPPDDVAQHRTLPTVGNIGLEHRPVVIIYSGAAAPADVFTSVQYRRTWFWIVEEDFDSKLAFTIVSKAGPGWRP